MSSTGSETSNFASSTGDIAMSTGPGRTFVARALRVPSFGLMLCGVLAELGWGGWRLVGLPALLKATPGLLQAEPTLGNASGSAHLDDGDRGALVMVCKKY
jgi:hypothetical protein